MYKVNVFEEKRKSFWCGLRLSHFFTQDLYKFSKKASHTHAHTVKCMLLLPQMWAHGAYVFLLNTHTHTTTIAIIINIMTNSIMIRDRIGADKNFIYFNSFFEPSSFAATTFATFAIFIPQLFSLTHSLACLPTLSLPFSRK